MNEHREAIQYDLLTETGYQLRDIGQTLSWGTLNSFLKNEQLDSALVREMHPEEAAWGTRTKTNAILADIFDMLANINANLVSIGSGKPAKKPKPYPRPKRRNQDDQKHFGRGALPVNELQEWFEKKGRQNAGSSKRDSGSDAGPVRSAAVTN